VWHSTIEDCFDLLGLPFAAQFSRRREAFGEEPLELLLGDPDRALDSEDADLPGADDPAPAAR
jgi:hypothetical protein